MNFLADAPFYTIPHKQEEIVGNRRDDLWQNRSETENKCSQDDPDNDDYSSESESVETDTVSS